MLMEVGGPDLGWERDHLALWKDIGRMATSLGNEPLPNV